MTQPPSHFESTTGLYRISTDPARLDYTAIHAYLTESYWARGRTYDAVVRAVQHSLCFGLYHGDAQVGLARVVTDYTVYAYLCDVYVLDSHQGRGLGKRLIRSVLKHPELQTVTRWTLITADAQEFYAQAGFAVLAEPAQHLEMVRTPR